MATAMSGTPSSAVRWDRGAELPSRAGGPWLAWRDGLRRCVARLLGHAVHGVEHENGEMGANLIGIEVGGLDGPAETRRRVSGASLVHHQRNDVIRALLAGAKVGVRRRELGVHLANRAFERTSHPANGSGWRSRTTVPVKVDPVVPVSSTL